ncbi:MAG: hypothetical protein OEM04_13125 [Flavobacteriaceae bacterium]|nr:hypothetical protein [Flavobacteriaceae bacterium]
MKLEFKILDFLNSNNNERFVDITFIDENYEQIKDACKSLSGRNLVVIDSSQSRDFEAFGISNQRIKRIKAKINMNGRIYLHSLKNNSGEFALNSKRRKNKWKLSYFFNF